MSKALIFLCIFFFSFSITCKSQDLKSIRDSLERINLQSLDLRKRVMPTIQKFGYESEEMKVLNEKIQTFDSMALFYAVNVIDQYGWLGSEKIGYAANHMLYLSIQHAPNPELRTLYFPLLEASAKKGSSNLVDMATMKDRILIDAGLPQRYGTQSQMINGQLELYPLEDFKNVNKKRKTVGLKKLKL